MVIANASANAPDLTYYGGVDPRDLPRYSYKEASHATQVPASTIAAWVRGMTYTRRGKNPGYVESVIERPFASDSRLSFYNLLEVHVLRALRQVHEVKLDAIRFAIGRAREEHGITRLLTDPKLVTSGGALFLDYYLHLVELDRSRQIAMRQILKGFLTRVQVDEEKRYSAFFPFPRSTGLADQTPILVSPFISFGKAVIERTGVSTFAIVSRVNAGESPEEVITDYRLTEAEFGEAILYETAA